MLDQCSTLPAKKTRNSPASLEKIQAKTEKGASILSIWLENIQAKRYPFTVR